MLFNSFEFILAFFPICFAVYWALRAAGLTRISIVWLLIASLAFYFYGETQHGSIILASILFNFLIGRLIRASGHPRSTIWMVVGVSVNLLALGIFKYSGFVLNTLADAGLIGRVPWTLGLPIGISFFTFTQIAYLVDVHRGHTREYGLANYGLFVTFFPHLVAGPILHHAEMMPQFAKDRSRNWVTCVADGLPLFAIGLFKKAVVADGVAPLVDILFGTSGGSVPPSLFPAWAAALAYTVQIYFDFSGYSDMAIGLARMLGIDLPINFNSPYKATSISDFWRRWHITLSRFLREYLYIPLGGNRRGVVRTYVNLLITMVLGGIWHGAGWTFMLWGFMHGAYLALARAWSAVAQLIGVKLPAYVARGLTLLAVVIAWVPFRAQDLTTTVAIWRGMLGLGGVALPSQWKGAPQVAQLTGLPLADISITGTEAATVIVSLIACLVLPNSQQVMSLRNLGLDSPGYKALESPPLTSRLLLRWNVWWAAGIGLMLGVALRTIGDYSAFIYFNF